MLRRSKTKIAHARGMVVDLRGFRIERRESWIGWKNAASLRARVIMAGFGVYGPSWIESF